MSMTPLIDADILAYEIGFAAQKKIGEEIVPIPVEDVNTMVDDKIKEICAAVYATEPPKLFLTGKNNFRYEIAKQQEYKGGRKKVKPFHWRYIREYMIAQWGAVVYDGIEADDALAIEQTKHLAERNTIICSRDKDLRQIPGYTYSWECGKQGSFGPEWVDELGWIKLKGPKKIVGTGLKFFYSQVLTGDSTDTYGGLPGCGPIRAFAILNECNSDEEMYNVVLEAFTFKYGEEAEERMLEQGRLAWMVRSFKEDGKPILWKEEM